MFKNIIFILSILILFCSGNFAYSEIELSRYNIFSNLTDSEFDYKLTETQSPVVLFDNTKKVLYTSINKNKNLNPLELSVFTIDSIGKKKPKHIRAKRAQNIAKEYDSSHYDESEDIEDLYLKPLNWLEFNLRLF